jgi:hypothetical protein
MSEAFALHSVQLGYCVLGRVPLDCTHAHKGNTQGE